MFKMLCMALTVHNGYLALRHFGANVAIGIYSCFLSINFIGFYRFVFDSAYKLPVGMEKVQQRLMGLTQKVGSRESGNELRKLVSSVPIIRVKVGSFHDVEKDATLNFIDFVVHQLVGLLVSFE